MVDGEGVEHLKRKNTHTRQNDNYDHVTNNMLNNKLTSEESLCLHSRGGLNKIYINI